MDTLFRFSANSTFVPRDIRGSVQLTGIHIYNRVRGAEYRIVSSPTMLLGELVLIDPKRKGGTKRNKTGTAV